MPSSRLILGVLPWYSVLIVCGMCAALLLCTLEEKRLGLPKETTIDLALFVIPLGVIGARLYYVFFAWDMFRGDPISILKVWNGGLAIYGGVIGGLLGACIFAWRRKVSLLPLCDMIAPGLVLAQAIGRWGNFFNMEAYGLPVTDPALQFFPFAVLIPENGSMVWHMATFFYESMWNLCAFVVLWRLRKHKQREGDLLLWYMLLYGAGRLMIEGLRTDSLMTTGGSARVSQLLSVALCLCAVLMFMVRRLLAATRTARVSACAAAVIGAVAGGWSSLQAAQPPFIGYMPVCMLICGLALGCAMLQLASLTPLLCRLPGLLPAAFAIGMIAVLCTIGSTHSGAEFSLLLCACLSVTAICTGAIAFTPIRTVAARHDRL